jgi:hypothetical protein
MAAKDTDDYLELLELEQKVERFISRISKPLFMARMFRSNPKGGGRKNYEKAILEIDRIAREYGADQS